MKEHDTVRLVSAVHDKRRVFAAGTIGAIVSVYDDGKAFAVELQTARRKPAILTIPAEFLEVVCFAQPSTGSAKVARLGKSITDLDVQIQTLMERRNALSDQQKALVGIPAKQAPVLGPATHLVRVERIVKQTAYIWQKADTPGEAMEAAKETRAWLYSQVLQTRASLATLKDAAEHRTKSR